MDTDKREGYQYRESSEPHRFREARESLPMGDLAMVAKAVPIFCDPPK